MVCIEDLECEQVDIETAFQNGVLEEEVYMQLPQGLKVPGQEGLVCRLQKSIYGLKQAPRAWHKALVQYLTTAGFEALQCEACIFVRSTGIKTQIVDIYGDDLVLIAKTKGEVAEMKAGIQKAFRGKDMGGPVSYIVGIKVVRDRAQRKLWINQQLSADNIVNRFNMQHAFATKVPSIPEKKLRKVNGVDATGDVMSDMATKPFRQASDVSDERVEAELAFSIQDVSLFLNAYAKPHWEAVKQIIKYVKGTTGHGLGFSGSDIRLSAYSDSDYAAEEDERKSVSGYVTFIGNCAVTWSSRKQRIVTQSTVEAEYIALAHCTREVLFIWQLLSELGYEQGRHRYLKTTRHASL
ncbi:LOW QUALITY PROTEIN: reverse transcriptase [Phytophthora megakarya]|uniref:Reverse transcriptase n=1 Tax=Phytophthora megakarya TaxID=4795 RepID=A0A225VPI7_9STRA|nr:LOW QUALITY PROTEIN: reverse transcriptase [Phytophthora megakarya]